MREKGGGSEEGRGVKGNGEVKWWKICISKMQEMILTTVGNTDEKRKMKRTEKSGRENENVWNNLLC